MGAAVCLSHLHGILREEFILVIDLTFYADESGIHDPHGEQPGSEVASIAGYIGTKKQWETWERRWNTALNKFKVPQFHMSEFNRKDQKPDSNYFGWSDKKKKRFLRLLIKIASEVPLAGYGSLVRTKAWDSILGDDAKVGIPGKRKGDYHIAKPVFNPYLICFQNFFAKFPKYLDEVVNPLLGKRGPVRSVAFVFHQHKVFGPAAEIGFMLSQEVLKDERLSTITLAPVQEYPPIQSADLLAFYSRRRFIRFLNNIPPDEFEQALLDPDPDNPDRVYLLELNDENLAGLQENSLKLRSQRAKQNLRGFGDPDAYQSFGKSQTQVRFSATPSTNPRCPPQSIPADAIPARALRPSDPPTYRACRPRVPRDVP
jgi:hypothetical protein